MQEKLKARDRIMNVASSLFYRQGYNQTGINQIIAEAGIAIGSLYNHFPSKQDLLLAYLKKQEVEWFEGFEKFSKGATNPKGKIFKFIDYRIEQQKESDFSGCPFIKIAAELGVSDLNVLQVVDAYKEKQRSLLTGLFRQVQYDGPLSRKELADNLFLMVEGATVSTTISRNTLALEGVKKIMKAIIK
jgi:AcrR family transcriptional regulator